MHMCIHEELRDVSTRVRRITMLNQRLEH